MNEYELERGASFGAVKTRTQTLRHAETSQVKYDLIGKVAEGTVLTRRTVAAILSGIQLEKFYMFRNNPEEFITKVIRLIKEQKATMIVEHISYNRSKANMTPRSSRQKRTLSRLTRRSGHRRPSRIMCLPTATLLTENLWSGSL